MPLRFHLGPWKVQTDLNRLSGPSGSRTLEPKVMGVLVCLAESHGTVVSKSELVARVWNGQHIADSAITRSISELRRALGDDAQNPSYIETIPTRGYRLIAVPRSQPLELCAPGQPDTAATNPSPPAEVSRRLWRIPGRYQVTALAFLVVVAMSLAWRKYDLPSEFVEQAASLAPVRLMQVSTEPGLESFPDYSPDSSSVVYSGLVDGRYELFVQQLTPGGSRLQLTFDGGQNVQPAWSPDGRSIAYHSISRGGIWLVPALGGEARRLSAFGSAPDWLIDSKALVFQSGAFVEAVPTSVPALPPSRLYRVAVSDSAPRPLTHPGIPIGGHGAPRVSPDGKRVVFTAADTTGRKLHTIKTDGSDLRTVAGAPTIGVVFSPDGRYLYSSGPFQGEKWLWRTPISTATGEALGPPERVTRGAFRGLSHSSSQPRLMAEVVDQESHLYTLDLDPTTGSPLGAERQLTRGTNFRDTSPAFSPDGSLIAYRQVRIGQLDQIWLVDRDGHQNSQLTLDPNIPAHFPTFTADGTGVLYQTRWTDQRTLQRIDLFDKRSGPWLTLPADWQNMRLSQDGSLAVFHKSAPTAPADASSQTSSQAPRTFGNGRAAESSPFANNVWIAGTSELAQTEVRQLTFETGFAGFPVLSPSNTHVAYEVEIDGRMQIEIQHLGTGRTRRITGSGENWPGSFIDDRFLTFVAQRDGIWNLYLYDLAEEAERPLTANGSSAVYYRVPNASPDGRFVVYERGTVDGDLWQIALEG